ECSALSEQDKHKAAQVALEAGVAFLKTSTGYGAHGATVEDVQLLARLARGRVAVKASGGIRDLEVCQAMLAAGASRIGTSSGVAIMQQWSARECGV
ncbi:MAG: 2-deoxyribose-5-phosphate aldolase, partial [Desulfuromonas sp.]